MLPPLFLLLLLLLLSGRGALGGTLPGTLGAFLGRARGLGTFGSALSLASSRALARSGRLTSTSSGALGLAGSGAISGDLSASAAIGSAGRLASSMGLLLAQSPPLDLLLVRIGNCLGRLGLLVMLCGDHQVPNIVLFQPSRYIRGQQEALAQLPVVYVSFASDLVVAHVLAALSGDHGSRGIPDHGRHVLRAVGPPHQAIAVPHIRIGETVAKDIEQGATADLPHCLG
mmetsp:Transcript_67798/g.219381  ORF Transcript_67798/g.219381 Transcript_67798/m.219381 type:complete len:229 (-) Transcript_67798:608-1294(-)